MNSEELYKSIEIFRKYYGEFYFHGEHEELFGPGYEPGLMSEEDEKSLVALGWSSAHYECWRHYCSA